MTNLLTINKLDVQFPTRHGTTYAVQDVNLELQAGEVLGLVGESGAGKSTIGNAIINLLEPPGQVTGGKILFQGRNLRDLSDEQMRDVRGKKIGMIFQDPQTSLNPLITIGAQLVETIIKATDLTGAAAVDKAVDLLKSVGITEIETR